MSFIRPIYLEELISIQDCVPSCACEFPGVTFVLVEAVWNRYGILEIEEKLFSNSEWENIQEKRYYMG